MTKKLLAATALMLLLLGSAIPQATPQGPIVLKLATHVFPPFQYKENGKVTGPMIAVMQALCSKVKVDCKIEMAAFKNSFAATAAGEADILFTVTLNEEQGNRLAPFYLSPFLVETKYSFFVENQSTWRWTGDARDLDNTTLIAFGPATTSHVASRLATLGRGTNVIITPSTISSFQRLILGGGASNTVVVANKDVGLFLARTHQVIGPKAAGDISVAYLGFVFSKKSKHVGLAKEFLDAADALKADGTIGKLLRSIPDHPLMEAP